MKKFSLILVFFTTTLFAQFTIKGVVVDPYNQALPFVNVLIKGTSEGITTDDKGKFSIYSPKRRIDLEVSFMGFETKIVKVTSKNKKLKIVLKEEVSNLEEVIVVSRPKKRLKKKENPAYKILKEFWKRKHKMGVEQADHYQYKKHTFTEVGLNNIDTIFIKTLFKEQYDEAMQEVKYDSDGRNYYIPINIHEQVFKIYGNNKIGKKRIDIEAERKEGLSSKGFIFDRMSNTFRNFNVFKNNINLLRKSFVSPLSSTGFATYDYLLYDSIIRNNTKLYNIYFFPRRKSDFAFQGNVWIADKTFAVNRLRMKVTKQSGVNFVRGLTIEKHFEIKDGIYLPVKDIYEGDFTFLDKKEDNKGVTIKKIDEFSAYNFKRVYPADFYEVIQQKIRPDQFKKNESYWTEKATTETKETYKLIRSVKGKRQIKNITEALNILVTGYVNLPKMPLQIGDLWTFLNYNQVEGFRTKLSFRTFKTKDDRFRANAFIAYGFKDKKIKYGIDGKYVLSFMPRISIGASYQDDVEQLGRILLDESNLIKNPNAGSSPIIARGNNYFLSKVKRYTTKINYALTPNFRFGLSLSRTAISSATTPDKFSIAYLDKGQIKQNVIDTASDVFVCYTPNRVVYGLGARQRVSRELYSTFLLNFRRGYKGILGGTHDYNKIQLRVIQPIILGSFGVSEATFDVGKTFGSVPISLLSPIPANQSYAITPNTFSLMNYYDYVTDTYASLHLEHHFNGFILNRIPLLKKLKWRSLATFRLAYGTISEKNKLINKSNINYVAPNEKPYYEYGVGIENIGIGNLRIFRVDAIWRGNYQPAFNNLSEPTPKFAIRIGINPSI